MTDAARPGAGGKVGSGAGKRRDASVFARFGRAAEPLHGPPVGPAFHPRDRWVPLALCAISFAFVVWPGPCVLLPVEWLLGEQPPVKRAEEGWRGIAREWSVVLLLFGATFVPTLWHQMKRRGARWEEAHVLERRQWTSGSSNSRGQTSTRTNRSAKVRIVTGPYAGRDFRVSLTKRSFEQDRLMVLVRLGPLRAGPWATAAWPAGAPPLLIAAVPIVLAAALFALGHRPC